MTMILTRPITLDDILERLRTAHARINFEGRFSFAIDQSSPLDTIKNKGRCYIMHWFRPTPYAFEDCKSIGSGSLSDCMDALEDYVVRYPRTPTQEELARTLGLPEKPVNRRALVSGYGDITAQAAEFRDLAGADMEFFFREGWQALVDGTPLSRPPYEEESHAFHAWEQGWLAADRYLST
jgi:hypothetical protein